MFNESRDDPVAFLPCTTFLVCFDSLCLCVFCEMTAKSAPQRDLMLHPLACHTFYQNDLFVMVDILLRHLADIDEASPARSSVRCFSAEERFEIR